MQETQVQSLARKEETATHSNILAWKIPWTEEPGGLQFKGLQRVRRYWATEMNWKWIKFHQWLVKVKVNLLICARFFASSWTVPYQASQSMGFFRQEYWSWLPFPFPGDLPDPGIEPRSPALQADALLSEPPGKPFLAEWCRINFLIFSFLGLCKVEKMQSKTGTR